MQKRNYQIQISPYLLNNNNNNNNNNKTNGFRNTGKHYTQVSQQRKV